MVTVYAKRVLFIETLVAYITAVRTRYGLQLKTVTNGLIGSISRRHLIDGTYLVWDGWETRITSPGYDYKNRVDYIAKFCSS